jgi:hypothetical protein
VEHERDSECHECAQGGQDVRDGERRDIAQVQRRSVREALRLLERAP